MCDVINRFREITSREWYKDRVLHNENGPAVENEDGSVEYWIKGKHLTEAEFIIFFENNRYKKYSLKDTR